MSRLDKLVRIPEIELDELEAALYSKTTLKKLFDTLPVDDHKNIGRDMARKKLDWKNPKGIAAFAFFKEYVDTERGVLEPFRDIAEVKQKNKTVFKIDSNPPSYPPPHFLLKLIGVDHPVVQSSLDLPMSSV